MSKSINKKTKHKRKQTQLSPIPKPLLWAIGGLMIVAVGWFFWPSPSTSLASAPTPESIQLGAQVFQKNCASCHGPGAIGQDPQQPMGGMTVDNSYLAPALNGTGHAWHHPDKLLIDIITNGSVVQESPMRGFKGRLSDQEIAAVLHYFKSLWPPEVQERHAKFVNQHQ